MLDALAYLFLFFILFLNYYAEKCAKRYNLENIITQLLIPKCYFLYLLLTIFFLLVTFIMHISLFFLEIQNKK